MSGLKELPEVFVFIAFVGTVTTIFSWSLLILFRLLIRSAKKTKTTVTGREKTVLAFGTIGFLCVLYGWLIEPYWLSIENVRLESTKLHRGQSVRIAHISDLHCDPEKRLEDRLPKAISEQHPDLIVFTGDAINSPEGLQNFRECLKEIATVAPTFVVKGNWDSWYFKDLDRFGGTGAKELTAQASPLRVRGSTIWIGGLPVGSKTSIKDAMAPAPASDYRVFLFHYPDLIDEMRRNKIDLYLAGHTHGGQVALPFYGALITLAATGKKYESGLHSLGDTYIYTNRGIGMEGGKAPRVRFCARPELTIIDVQGIGERSIEPSGQ